jgi:sugar/nucleoside kinase (ribokinase family)
LLVAGHIAKDIHIKIGDSNRLPKEFKKLLKISVPVSMISDILGEKWSFEEVLTILKDSAIEPISYSYGGRGPNVAYGAALLEACVELVSFVGEDFDKQYPGFFDGGYRTHLRKAGVNVSEVAVESDKLHNINEDEHDRGIVAIRTKEIPSIYCVKDSFGTDFYLIDDLKGAHTHAANGPIPKLLVRRCDGVFVTSNEPPFNLRLIDYAFLLGKKVFFDVAAYGTTSQYLKEVIPKCDTIFGNTFEMVLVMKAFNASDVTELFHVSADISTIIVEDKIACTLKIHQREWESPLKVGPLRVERRVSSVGCCDGIAAGYVALRSQGYDLLTAAKAGLVECASVWRMEGVQEGMLDKPQLFQRLNDNFIPIQK